MAVIKTVPKSTIGTPRADKFVGTEIADKFLGFASADTLIGMAGNDTLDGGTGNDTLDGGIGNDSLLGGDGDDSLIGGVGNDFLSGDKGNDKLTGNAGNDTLNGGSGVDIMTGGDGNDYYVVDNVKDVVTEISKNGNDTVETAGNYTLVNNVENLILSGFMDSTGTGNKLNNVITGNVGDNVLKGDVGNDSLLGGGGEDTLDGGLGMDTLNGGAGADTYFMNNTEDLIIEDENSIDQDQVIATVNYDLNVNPSIEILTLQGNKAISGIGNDLGNTLQEFDGGKVANNFNGGGGDDVINAEGGNDTLEGGEGDDELNGGAGKDVAIYNGAEGDYQITPNVDVEGVAQLIIKYVGTGQSDEGTDILSDIEIVQFSDGTQKTVQTYLNGEETPIEKPVDVGEAPPPVFVETPIEKPVEIKPTPPTVSNDAFERAATKPPADMTFAWDIPLTEGDDTLDLGSLPNAPTVRIMALGGNDTIQGGDASVGWIDGGDGNDSIFGGNGTSDTLLGGVGDDFLAAYHNDYYS